MRALYTAASGMNAQQANIDNVANNLANVNTTGYKKSRAVFEDLLYQNVRQVGGSTSQDTMSPTGLSLGTGVRIVATEKSFTQGNLSQTGNSLDMAISGRGFFQVLLPDGTMGYTRDGNFEVNAQGELVTVGSGYRVQPGIQIPDGVQSVTVGKDGVVTVQVSGQASPTQIGSLQLVDFINPSGLQPRGENLFMESAASGSPQTGTPGLNGLGTIEQGSLEASNVNVVEELVNMIETQRAYEMNAKAISTTDSMLGYLNNNI